MRADLRQSVAQKSQAGGRDSEPDLSNPLDRPSLVFMDKEAARPANDPRIIRKASEPVSDRVRTRAGMAQTRHRSQRFVRLRGAIYLRRLQGSGN